MTEEEKKILAEAVEYQESKAHAYASLISFERLGTNSEALQAANAHALLAISYRLAQIVDIFRREVKS